VRSSKKERLSALLLDASEKFRAVAKKAKILSALSWTPAVAAEFFLGGEDKLPRPQYAIDRAALEDCIAELEGFAPRLAGTHPVLEWLEANRKSYLDGFRLLLNVETEAFYELSSQLYGNSSSVPFGGKASNRELAGKISSRLSVCAFGDVAEAPRADAESFVRVLEKRLEERFPLMNVRVETSDQIVAKVAAGTSRVRVRKDATFTAMELESLWKHEVETHCLTAQNGSAQTQVPMLASGGARSTLTQEGLAVFHEVYGHTMAQNRLLRLCDRVEAVAMAEAGADFVEVYRWFLPRTDTKIDAFYSAQRIFRGATLSGGKPFTKDVVYVSGLLGVYAFLNLAVKNQNRPLVEALVCGRMAIEDAGTVAWLRANGFVEPPKFLPEWLANWEALLSFFCTTALFAEMDGDGYRDYFSKLRTFEPWDIDY
jgi:uncharacterized protein (TIGR02421 family)